MQVSFQTPRYLAKVVALQLPADPALEEVLVDDSRAGLSPADMVDHKFLVLLSGAAILTRKGNGR